MDDIKVTVAIPFPTKQAAKIAYDVLRIDPEPKRNHIKKKYQLCDNILTVELNGDVAKNVRTALTNFYESLILCVETQDQFGPPVSPEYSHY